MAFKMKGMKFYGDRTRKEMRQDIKEHRKSLGGDKEAIKADRKYQRGRKKELRGEEFPFPYDAASIICLCMPTQSTTPDPFPSSQVPVFS